MALDAVTFVTWNIPFLTTNTKDWPRRKLHIVSTLRSLSPDLIAVQEVCGKTHGRPAVAEIAEALGEEWARDPALCNIHGNKSHYEHIAFLWKEDHAMFRGRTPSLATLSLAVKNQPLNRSVRGLNVSLPELITALTNGRISHEMALKSEAEIMQGLAKDLCFPQDGLAAHHEISNWNFDRLPAFLMFEDDDGTRPPLHVVSFHLSTEVKQQRAEVRFLQRLMMLAWENGSFLIAMGDHNADMSLNPAIWDEGHAVEGFAQCAQRFIPPMVATNVYPYITQETGAQRNDDIFCGKSNAVKVWTEVGCVPSEIIRDAEKVIVAREVRPSEAVPEAQISECLADISKILLRFGKQPDLSRPASMLFSLRGLLGLRDDAASKWRHDLRHYWSDHRPLAARIEFSSGDHASQPDVRSAALDACTLPPPDGADGLSRLKAAAMAIPADAAAYPDGITVARMIAFAAGVHCAASGGLMKQECRCILDRLGVAGAEGMKTDQLRAGMKRVLLECGFDGFKELEKQMSQLAIASQAKFAAGFEAPRGTKAQVFAGFPRSPPPSPPPVLLLSASRSAFITLVQEVDPAFMTPIRPSRDGKPFLTPATNQRASARTAAAAVENRAKDPQHGRTLQTDVEIFHAWLAKKSNCDLERIRHAAAGKSWPNGGLNKPDIAELLAQFNITISQRPEADKELTALLVRLGLT
jgi:endonuclease/exonuclease/phosphatase family metal-dependent hydrolase